MNLENGKDLFQLQSQIIDSKIEMAINKSTDRIIDNINKIKFTIEKPTIEQSTIELCMKEMEDRMNQRLDDLKSINSNLNRLNKLFFISGFLIAIPISAILIIPHLIK
jgi:hypothetical protein